MFEESSKDIRTRELLKLLKSLSKLAKENGKLLVVQGGFAVDLAAGEITRKHDDLDLIVLEDDVDWYKKYFEKEEYKFHYHEEQNKKVSFGAYKWNEKLKDSLHVDIGGIKILGDEVSDLGDVERYIWPIKADELICEIEIDGQKIKYLNPKIVCKFKQKQKKRAKEDHDFKILEKAMKV